MAARRWMVVLALVVIGVLVAAAAEEGSFADRSRSLRKLAEAEREAGVGGIESHALADWMDVQAGLQEDAEACVEIGRRREQIHAMRAAGNDEAARERVEALEVELAAYVATVHQQRREGDERLRARLELLRKAWDMNSRAGRAGTGDATQRAMDEIEAGLATIERHRRLSDGMLELQEQVRKLTAQVAALKGQ